MIRIIALLFATAAVLLGGLWLLQGFGLVQIKPILCFADCAPIQGPSATWAFIGAVTLAACFRTLILVFLAELARLRRWPQLKDARYSRFGRLAITPIALKNPSARVRTQAASSRCNWHGVATQAAPEMKRQGKPMQIFTWIISGIVGIAVVYGAAYAFGAWRWKTATGALVTELNAGRTAPATTRYHAAELATLPAPVQRYFRSVLTDGQAIVTAVTLTQTGMFNLGKTTPQWKPFTAVQNFSTAKPGFVWDANITMFPGVPVRVVDAFTNGEGLLRPTLLGLISMGTIQGKGEIARGELLRHFAESVWFPTALLPSQGVVWQAVDDHSANATMTDGRTSVTMLFRFGKDGLVESIFVEGRATNVGTKTVRMPWECRMSNTQTKSGMRVPLTGEVLYITPEGEKPYFKGTIETVDYEFTK
jgi:hypothetical protein